MSTYYKISGFRFRKSDGNLRPSRKSEIIEKRLTNNLEGPRFRPNDQPGIKAALLDQRQPENIAVEAIGHVGIKRTQEKSKIVISPELLTRFQQKLIKLMDKYMSEHSETGIVLMIRGQEELFQPVSYELDLTPLKTGANPWAEITLKLADAPRSDWPYIDLCIRAQADLQTKLPEHYIYFMNGTDDMSIIFRVFIETRKGI